MVTIKDIAEKAGVSRGTVDRVLNNRGKVAPEKAALIKAIAEELNYKPNTVGQGLAVRKKRLKFVFCIPDWPNVPFFGDVYKGAKCVEKELNDFGVEVIFIRWDFSASFNSNAGELCFEYFKNHEVDGWVMDGPTADEFVALIKKKGKEIPPIVTYNIQGMTYKPMAHVGCDYEQSGRLACGMVAFASNNKAKVAMISCGPGPILFDNEVGRETGFRQEMELNYPQMQIILKEFVNTSSSKGKNIIKLAEEIVNNPVIDILYLMNPGDYSLCKMIFDRDRDKRIRIITNDIPTDTVRDMIRQDIISATICQEPEKQGGRPLRILFDYVAFGKKPQIAWEKTNLSIVMKQNMT